MQKLVRNGKGELIVTEVADIPEDSQPRSPIVTENNIPIQAVVPKMPVKDALKASLITAEQLLQKMQEAGGKNLTNTQFALLIVPCVKKSKDPIGHHKWDMALAHIRGLMKSLEEQGKVVSTKDTTSKRVRYLYSLK